MLKTPLAIQTDKQRLPTKANVTYVAPAIVAIVSSVRHTRSIQYPLAIHPRFSHGSTSTLPSGQENDCDWHTASQLVLATISNHFAAQSQSHTVSVTELLTLCSLGKARIIVSLRAKAWALQSFKTAEKAPRTSSMPAPTIMLASTE